MEEFDRFFQLPIPVLDLNRYDPPWGANPRFRKLLARRAAWPVWVTRRQRDGYYYTWANDECWCLQPAFDGYQGWRLTKLSRDGSESRSIFEDATTEEARSLLERFEELVMEEAL